MKANSRPSTLAILLLSLAAPLHGQDSIAELIPGLSQQARDSFVAHYDASKGIELEPASSNVASWTPVDLQGNPISAMVANTNLRDDAPPITTDGEALLFTDIANEPGTNNVSYLESTIQVPESSTSYTAIWQGFYADDAPYATSGTYAFNLGPNSLSHQRDDGGGGFVVELFNGSTYAGDDITAFDNTTTTWTTVVTANSHSAFADGTDLNVSQTPTPSYNILDDTQLFIGAFSPGGFDFVGEMRHLILFRSALSSTDQILIRQYLNARSGENVRYVNESANGDNDGTSWEDAFIDLQDALDGAGAGDVIFVAEGSYYPDFFQNGDSDDRAATFSLKDGVAIYGGFPDTGDPTFADRDPATHETILSGDIDQNDDSPGGDNSGNSLHVLTADGTVSSALLDGFTITAGNANDSSSPGNVGGGLFCSSASPTLTNCTFEGNSASSNGGAIYNNSSSPTLTNCSFQSNSASYGGAIYNSSFSSSPTLTNCSFQGNSATNNGGAIYNDISSPTLTNCSFQGNSARFGGAIYNLNSSPTLTNCSFQGNSAADDGGAIYNGNSSSASLTNCSFQGNSATDNGGAIRNFSSSITLTNCILWNNSESGSTAAPGASVASVGGSTTYAHCLVQNLNPTGPGNLDGTDPLNNPGFTSEVDPLLPVAQRTGGDLRLRPGSPAIDAGLSSANTTSTDIDGRSRRENDAIDLGAHESKTLYVSKTDRNDSTGVDFANPINVLQEALAQAQPGDWLFVENATYHPDEFFDSAGNLQNSDDRDATFALPSGIEIYGGFDYPNFTEFDDRDPATHETILSGDIDQNDGPGFANNAGNAFHVLTADGTDSSALLDGFTITAGNANDSSFPGNEGGGLRCSSGASPTLTNCSFQGNSAIFGGAIFNTNSSSPSLTNCSFQGNSALYGGAIFNTTSSSPTLTNCSFQGNSAQFDGGAIYINFSSPSLTNCSFQGNSATFGGAIYNFASSPSLTNCSFQGNSAADDGGAIRNFNSSPTLTNCILWNNSDSGSITAPGASVASDGGSITYAHCLVQNWTAAQLGGNGNLDGTDPLNNPRFLAEVNPLSAPTTGGDLRLLPGSSVLNAGDDLANSSTTDLAGNPRKAGTIDLGALEQQGFLYVKTSGSDSATGNSWATAFATPQKALAEASPGVTILIAVGTYYPDQSGTTNSNNRDDSFLLKSGVAILGGFPNTGDPTPSDRDPAAFPTILSGDIDQNDGPGFANNDGNAFHVLTADGTDSSARLDGFTITAGNANDSFPGYTGGGLQCTSGASPTIYNCSFQGNSATLGGAIFNTNSSSPSLTNCSFQGNSAVNSGGAIFNTNSSSPSITNCSFQGNSALYGGAIDNVASSPTLTNCSFQGNSAQLDGGAIYNLDSSPTLNNCILWNNSESGSITNPGASVANEGSITLPGAPVSSDGGTPTYAHCLVQNWTAAQLGGNGNLDGTDPLNNPRFTSEVDSLLPVDQRTGGDLRLRPGSPAIDAGLSSANTTSTDLNGRSRRENDAIDLGAHESKTLHVSKTDRNDSTGDDFDNPINVLQEALAQAQPGDWLFVENATYHPDEFFDSVGNLQNSDDRDATFALPSGIEIYGGFDYPDFTEFDDRDPAAHETILSGDIDQNDGPDFTNNAGNAFNILTAAGTDSSARLDGFTITAGNANGSLSQRVGGGLYCSNGASPSITNCSFQANSATYGGGAIYNFASSPSLTNCSFQGNFATVGGGAISNENFSSPTLTNCSFHANSAQFDGGAIYNSASSPTLNNCSFQGNSAQSEGGAIYNIDSSPTLTNCSFQGNSASSGGAIYNSFSSPTLTNCIFWNNSQSGSTTDPGASVANDNSTTTYSHCLVQNWTAAQLGGNGNLDGTNPANNPRFVAEVDPLAAPSLGGDLRLFLNSPALDAGLDSANSTETDLGGAPRFSGTIDLGAYEGHVDDPELLWTTDFDLDGRGYGLELIAGTDPEVADRDPLSSFVVQLDGLPVLRFTRRPDTQVDYVVKVMRSPDLSPGSFEEIFRITRSDFGSDTEGGNQFFTGGGNTIVTFGDEDPPEGKAFYRLEAEYNAP